MAGQTLAFVQARMGSSRLPGKVMLPLGDVPVVMHVVKRLRDCRLIDDVVVVTSRNPENDAMVDYLVQQGICVFRGDEANVFERFTDALGQFPCDHIVRVTADTPFIDPALCDQLMAAFLKAQADYAYLDESFAEGVDCEVMKSSALLDSRAYITLPSEREHVTQVFFNHEDKFEVLAVKNTVDDSHYRFTLDCHDDWSVIQAIADAAEQGSLSINYQEIKHYLDNTPSVKGLNASIIRNEGLLNSLKMDGNIDG